MGRHKTCSLLNLFLKSPNDIIQPQKFGFHVILLFLRGSFSLCLPRGLKLFLPRCPGASSRVGAGGDPLGLVPYVLQPPTPGCYCYMGPALPKPVPGSQQGLAPHSGSWLAPQEHPAAPQSLSSSPSGAVCSRHLSVSESSSQASGWLRTAGPLAEAVGSLGLLPRLPRIRAPGTTSLQEQKPLSWGGAHSDCCLQG